MQEFLDSEGRQGSKPLGNTKGLFVLHAPTREAFKFHPNNRWMLGQKFTLSFQLFSHASSPTLPPQCSSARNRFPRRSAHFEKLKHECLKTVQQYPPLVARPRCTVRRPWWKLFCYWSRSKSSLFISKKIKKSQCYSLTNSFSWSRQYPLYAGCYGLNADVKKIA